HGCEKPDAPDLRLLRARRERPHHPATEQRDEFASPHGQSLSPRIATYHVADWMLPMCIATNLPSASQLLWRSATSPARTSPATAPRLPDADRPSHATLTASHEISQLPTRSFCA